jgi:hypothetical protein
MRRGMADFPPFEQHVETLEGSLTVLERAPGSVRDQHRSLLVCCEDGGSWHLESDDRRVG